MVFAVEGGRIGCRPMRSIWVFNARRFVMFMKLKIFVAVIVAALCTVLSLTESRADPLAGTVRVNVANKSYYPVNITLKCYYYYNNYAGQNGGGYVTKEATIQAGEAQEVYCCTRSVDKNDPKREFVSCDPKTLDGEAQSIAKLKMETLHFSHNTSVRLWNVDILSTGSSMYFQLQ